MRIEILLELNTKTSNKNGYYYFHELISTVYLSLFKVALSIFLCFSLPSSLSAEEHNTPYDASVESKNNDYSLEAIMSDPNILRSKIAEAQLQSIMMSKDLSRLLRIEEYDHKLTQLLSISEILRNRLDELITTPEVYRHQARLFKVELENKLVRISGVLQQIDTLYSELTPWQNFWFRLSQNVSDLQEQLETTEPSMEFLDDVGKLKAIIVEARQKLRIKMEPLSVVKQKAELLQIEMYEIDYVFTTQLQERAILESRTVPIYSPDFIKQFDSNLWNMTFTGFQLVILPDLTQVQPYILELLVAVALFFIITISIRHARDHIMRKPKWRFLVQRRYALATWISLTFLMILSREIDTFWLLFPGMINLLCLWRLIDVILVEDYRKYYSQLLLLILLVADVFILISLPSPLERLFILSVSLVIIVVTFYHNLSSKLRQSRKTWMVLLGQLVILVMVATIVAEFIGKSEFAYFLFTSSLRTLFSLLVAWISYYALTNLLEMNLYHFPSAYITRYASTIHKLIQPLVFASIIFVLVLTLLVIWRVYPTGIVALKNIEQMSLPVGAATLSLSLVFQALLFLYLSFCVSKLLEIILLENILPGQNVDRGVQLSIIRLLNYFIVLVGFIGALMILGFNMTNITILGGAVGVGIGFGMQAIFNNFISGVILLFERPIKIGDVIMVDDKYGEVKELGFRATIVETLDHAEVVVPNSTLITSNVVNWTLAKRQVRIKIPIGVAYGTDVQQVIDIMTRCATEHPRVLSKPEPLALFLAHGESSLDFELRAFVPDVVDRMRTVSELNQAINSALEEAEIAIPFPQRDLHLKTVNETRGMGSTFGGEESQKKSCAIDSSA